MPIYMKIDGIKGMVQTTGFEDQINIESVSWGVGRSVSAFSGTSREVSIVSCSEITCSKILDSSSMALFRNSFFADPIPEVVITLARDKGAGEVEGYLVVTLKDVLITSFSQSASGGNDSMMESFSLNYGALKMEQTWRATDYAEGGNDEASYDIRTKAPL